MQKSYLKTPFVNSLGKLFPIIQVRSFLKKKVLGTWTYQLSKRGWNRLTEGQKQDMLDEYIDWKNRIQPTIAGPEWLEWIE